MLELMEQYADADFLGTFATFAPAVGFGVILALIFAVIGWVFGLVIRLGKVEV